jgi:hypothetical protein
MGEAPPYIPDKEEADDQKDIGSPSAADDGGKR